MESRTTATAIANASANASTNASAATRTKHVLTITGGDSYLGHCIAAYLLRESERDGRNRHNECCIRVLCCSEKNCDDLRDMGAEIVEIDYEDRKCLRRAFRDSEYAIFVPEMTRNRVRHGECLIEAMECENIRHVLMISTIGAESHNRELRNLCEFRELENYLKDNFNRGRWCIFRLDFFQQCFLFWAPMIQDERVLKISIGRDGRFAPVNILDVCRAIYCSLTRHHRDSDRHGDHGRTQTQTQTQAQAQAAAQVKETSQGFRWVPLDERHHRRVYSLTGCEAVCGDEIARILGDAIDEREIQFKDVSRSEMRKELERWRDEDGKRGRHGDERRGDERRDGGRKDNDNDRKSDGRRHRDGKFRHGIPLRKHLNDTTIETVLDFFEYVKLGGADFTSGDLQDIIDKKPESLEEFFRDHRDEFRGDNDKRDRDEIERRK